MATGERQKSHARTLLVVPAVAAFAAVLAVAGTAPLVAGGVRPGQEPGTVAVDEVEQGEWFDPAFLVLVKDRATKVSVAEGEQRTQDLKAPSMSVRLRLCAS